MLGANDDTSVNGGVVLDYMYDRTSFALGNGSDEILLDANGLLIDVVRYDNGDDYPDEDGRSLSLDYTTSTYSATGNDLGENWCSGTDSYGDGDMGTPGSRNPACPAVVDADFDGFYSDEDCDDSDPNVFPGAAGDVPYDGVDTDCDGADDFDADQDGYQVNVYEDSNGDLQIINVGDCDDANPDVNPAVAEVSCDGIDNNCDDTIDEGSPDTSETFETNTSGAISNAVDLNSTSSTGGLMSGGDSVSSSSYLSVILMGIRFTLKTIGPSMTISFVPLAPTPTPLSTLC